MTLRNTEAGYGVVTKLLHWVTVVALLAQFVLGYAMESLSEWVAGDDSSGHGRGRGGDGSGGGHGRGGGDSDDLLVFAHAWLGGTILAIAALRVVWRRTTPLPPWSDRLSDADRVVAHWTERALYLLLFIIPATGLALLFLSGEDRKVGNDEEWQPPFDLVDDDTLLAAHIASHIAFYVALAFHVGLALRRRTLTRML